mmetsp:Transcript_51220/g.125803  ORF Transcript_51220/g.125803 Transcript_51220/m.125803 type:complete len:224 (-) Transcript_51220:1862-2533(-)
MSERTRTRGNSTSNTTVSKSLVRKSARSLWDNGSWTSAAPTACNTVVGESSARSTLDPKRPSTVVTKDDLWSGARTPFAMLVSKIFPVILRWRPSDFKSHPTTVLADSQDATSSESLESPRSQKMVSPFGKLIATPLLSKAATPTSVAGPISRVRSRNAATVAMSPSSTQNSFLSSSASQGAETASASCLTSARSVSGSATAGLSSICTPLLFKKAIKLRSSD